MLSHERISFGFVVNFSKEVGKCIEAIKSRTLKDNIIYVIIILYPQTHN